MRRRCERGATAVEYGLLVALIVVLSIPAVRALGLALQAAYLSTACTYGTGPSCP